MSKKKLIIYVGLAIAMFVISSLLIVPLENAFNPIVSLSAFSIICSLALSLLVYSTEQIPKRKLFSKNIEKFAVGKKQAFILAVIMFICALVFFFIGFYFRGWYFAWIVFLAGGIVIDILKRKVYRK